MRPRPLRALPALLSLLTGCAAHTTGVVRPVDGAPTLGTMQGRTWRLSSPDAAILASLDGCTLEVEGARLGGLIRVQDWRVVDSVYGPGVFVGTVREWGTLLAIEDRNTGTTLALAAESGEALRPYVGRAVLLAGPVVGDRQVQVVAFRVLGVGD